MASSSSSAPAPAEAMELSVSSRSRRRGGSPVRRRISSTRRLSSPPLSWWALTLTETSTPLLARSVHARSSTQPPTALMSPLSSASGMKSAGRRRPELGMVPAHQRLEAVRRPGGQVDDGLVLEQEAPIGQGSLEGTAQVAAPVDRLGQASIEQLDPPVADGLGGVHRGVGIAQQLLGDVGRVAVVRHPLPRGNPDACGQRHRARPELEGLGQRPQDPIGRGARLVGRCLLEQEGELVAAEPADAVLRPRHRAEAGTHQPQQLVAGGVPEGVVDVLEVVQVDEEHREPHARVPAPDEGVGEAVGEEDAVRAARSAGHAAPGAAAGPRGACGR